MLILLMSPRMWTVAGQQSHANESPAQMEYLEGQEDLVSGLIRRITRVTIWVIGVIKLLTKSP